MSSQVCLNSFFILQKQTRKHSYLISMFYRDAEIHSEDNIAKKILNTLGENICIKLTWMYWQLVKTFLQIFRKTFSLLQFSSVTQSCPTLCEPMNHSTPGFPVHHQLPEFTQTPVHQVGDAIQPSHPLSSPFSPAPIPPSIRVFSNESTLCMRWPKYWSFSLSIIPSKEHRGLICFRMDWLDLLAV